MPAPAAKRPPYPIRFLLTFSVFLLMFTLYAQAQGVPPEVASRIEAAIEESKAFEGADAHARQDAAFRALDIELAGDPAARLLLRVQFYGAFIIPNGYWGEGLARRRAFITSQLDTLLAELDGNPDAELLRAARLHRLYASPFGEMPPQAPAWLEGILREGLPWWLRYQYQDMLREQLSHASQAGDMALLRMLWPHLEYGLGIFADGWTRHRFLNETLFWTLQKHHERRPPILPPGEWTELAGPVVMAMLEDPVFLDDHAVTMLFWMVPLTEAAFGERLAQIADTRLPGDARVMLQRSRFLPKGSAEASMLRAQAAVQAISGPIRRPEVLRDALRDEAQAALEYGYPANAMGAARGLFNVASAAEDLALALDLAARASIALEGGGMAAAQAFLGLVDDLEAQPASWKAARPGASWQEAIVSAEAASDAAPRAAAGWRQRALLHALACDGEAAMRAASMAYLLPEASVDGQAATLEAMSGAVRALTGSALASDAFAAAQADGYATRAAAALPRPLAMDRPRDGAAAEAAHAAFEAAIVGQAPGPAWTAALERYAADLHWAGHADESLGVAWSLSRWLPAEDGDAPQAAALALFAIRARDGHLARANAWADWRRFGPDGPDGLAGTADDLVNPMANEAWTLPAAWREGWRAKASEAERLGDTAGVVRSFLMAGAAEDLAEAMARLRRQRLALPFNEDAWRGHQALVAEALYAATGNPLAARGYADFLRYGDKGPDGVEGSLADPLAEVP